MRGFACAIVGVGLLAGTAHAGGVPAVTSFTGGSNFAIFYGGSTGDVVGFRFTADVDMIVNSLGVLNDQSDGVLHSAHMVGLWQNSDQALLASVSVDSTGTLIGQWYYEDISSVTLSAGGEYTLGALYTATDNDTYVSGPSSVVLNGISNTNGVVTSSASQGFVYPTTDSANLARLGPNMLWKPVPAPGALARLGLAGLTARRRRRA